MAHLACTQSDDDAPNLTSPRKAALFSGPGAAMAGGGMLAGGGLDFGSGAPSNLGKVNGAVGKWLQRGNEDRFISLTDIAEQRSPTRTRSACRPTSPSTRLEASAHTYSS